MPTRLNDPNTGAFVIIQQRLAENDLTGHILEQNAGEWCHLMLPMRYEPERSYVTMIGWKDPRETPGELLWPERFNEEATKHLEKRLGKFIGAGQLQQRPEPAGGGIIQRGWWKLWERKTFPPMDFILASLDTAYTEKTQNDFSALTVWGVFSTDPKAEAIRTLDQEGRPMYLDRQYAEVAPNVMLMYAWQERLEFHALVQRVARTCIAFKTDLLLVEAKAAGHSVAQELRRLYGNEKFGVQLFDPKSLDKIARLYSVQHLFEEGIIYAPDKTWAEMVITQVGQFPTGAFDDLVDTCSQAIRHLRDVGLICRTTEAKREADSQLIYPRGDNQPLYPT
jgi:predicted phage terminase large subunit-like protein